jgi:hypothetical protein
MTLLPSQLGPIQFTKDRCLKPIAHCESWVSSSSESLPRPTINPGSTAHASTSTVTFRDPQDFDIAMEDADERHHDIRGVILLIVLYITLTSHKFYITRDAILG